jgi:hypothetical protein
MRTYRLAYQQMQWPDRCAACGAEAIGTATSSCSVVTKVSYFVLFARTTHLRASVSYPVCRRHLWSSRLAGIISARNLFNLALGVGWGFFAFALVAAVYQSVFESGPLVGPGVLSVYVGIVGAGIALFAFGRRCTPVRLIGATTKSQSLSITNDDYAKDFESLNANLILPESD